MKQEPVLVVHLSLLDRYVDHVSLMTDLKVIAITFKKLIKPEGINQSGHATMEAFNGRN